MRQSPETHALAAEEARPRAHFRGWFLILIVLGWLGGWALLWWRGLPGVVALAAVVALLLVADARGLFTLRGRLPWARTGALGRALLLVLVVALLPLVVTLYLLAAIRAYARARRARVASVPVALAAESPTMDEHMAPPTEEAPATRPLPSTPLSAPASLGQLGQLGQPGATSRPTVRAFPFESAEEEPFAAVTESMPAAVPEEAEEDGAPARRRRGGLLVAGLAAVAALLLLSCGVLAYAGPARGLFVPVSSSGGKAVSPSGGGAASSGASAGLTPAASPSMTPTTTPRATTTPSPTPTPKAKHAPGHHPSPKARPQSPTPSGGANPSGSAGALQVIFTCAPDQLADPNHVCFTVPPSSQVVAIIHARCVSPYAATLDARHAITPDGDGALAWAWRPQRECQSGSARVTLRITLDGFTGEVPVGWFRAGWR